MREKKDGHLLPRLGKAIKKRMRANGMTIESLAFGSGLARSSVREILAGRSNPQLLSLVQISWALGFSKVQELLDLA